MQQPAQSPPFSPSANFAGLLAELASPPPEDAAPSNSWSENNLGDDVVTLSYDRALRAHSRCKPADESDRPLTQEEQTGAATARDAAILPAAESGGSLSMEPGDAARGANKGVLRSASVTVRLSNAECARLHTLAAEAGMTVSAYLRSCTFEAEVLRAQVKKALAELRASALKVTAAAPAKERPIFGWLARLLPRGHSTIQDC